MEYAFVACMCTHLQVVYSTFPTLAKIWPITSYLEAKWGHNTSISMLQKESPAIKLLSVCVFFYKLITRLINKTLTGEDIPESALCWSIPLCLDKTGKVVSVSLRAEQ